MCGVTGFTGTRIVTVILGLALIRDRSALSRFLDMVPGCSDIIFKTRLALEPDTWPERIDVVVVDGFTGFKSAAAEELPGMRAVMDPLRVVRLAGNVLDECGDVLGRNSTIGAGGARIHCERSAGCYTSGRVYSRRICNIR